MKIVQGDEVQAKRSGEHRGANRQARRLLEGEQGQPGNFRLTLARSGGASYSPRHHHNFEQVRVALEGTLNYGRDGKVSAGTVGYFPEGAFYGPQTQTEDEDPAPFTLVLQFAGASGAYFLSNDEVNEGTEALKQLGEFKDGVFHRRKDVPGKRNLDAFQAIWEHLMGKPMVYPQPRYPAPILMDPSRYHWVDVPGAPGVSEKLLGVFTECRTEIGYFRFEPGASHALPGRGAYLVMSGAGMVENQPYRHFTAIYADHGENARFVASAPTEILHFGLPDLRGVEVDQRPGAIAQAAE